MSNVIHDYLLHPLERKEHKFKITVQHHEKNTLKITVQLI